MAAVMAAVTAAVMVHVSNQKLTPGSACNPPRRQSEAKAAQVELKKAVKSQEKFFATAGGSAEHGCYEEGQKHIRGQRPC
jgi:hypothetical protein